MRPTHTFWLSVLLAALTAPLVAADVVRVTSVARDGKVWVSFELSGAFTPEVQDAIHSGLPTTFTYDVDLRRDVPLWPDRTLASATIAVTVTYDTLTRRHQLSRTLNGHIEANRVTEDEDEVRHWLTVFDRLPLFATSDLEANTEYYLRVRVQTQPHDSWFFWPWDRSLASANSSFTFIP
jgi:hypothetical protein